VALPALKKPKVPAWKQPVKTAWKPPKPLAAPRSTTAGLTPYTGYTGPGVQDFINSGQIGWNKGMGNIGYKPPPMQYPTFDWSQVAGGGNFGGGGGGADYGSMISGDWEVQDAEAAMGAQMARARGDFQAGLRSQLIDLGLSDTSKLGSLGQYIDAATIKAAVANKYSATAQNAQAAERAGAQNNAALAARGILSSGQTTKSAQDVTAGQESSNYSALRGFLEGGAQGLGSLGDLEYNLARGVAQARQAAAMRAADLYPGLQGGGEAGANGTLFAPGAGVNFAGVAGAGFNPNYVKPVRMTRQQFLQKKPQGVYANYTRAWNRQHPYGY